MNENAVAEVWRHQRTWSVAAGDLKERVSRLRGWSLVILLVGAVLGGVAGFIPATVPGGTQAAAIAAAVAVAISTWLRGRVGADATGAWTRARLVSESLKSELFTYLAGVTPYRGVDATDLLLDRVDRIISATGQLAAEVAKVQPDGRKCPGITDVESYVEHRITGQIDNYYRRRADEIGAKLQRFQRIDAIIGFGGALLVAIAGFVVGDVLTVWIGVLTTVGAALVAHTAQSEWEFQIAEYTRTASRLELLRARRDSGVQWTDDEFVAACERVLADQNEAWMAKLSTSAEVQQ
jgi:hypothetical protein